MEVGVDILIDTFLVWLDAYQLQHLQISGLTFPPVNWGAPTLLQQEENWTMQSANQERFENFQRTPYFMLKLSKRGQESSDL
jgi:hypothetical protein